eukprot:scaffold4246_cov161-Prasinococcus_capsulatus_cf.AAC.2
MVRTSSRKRNVVDYSQDNQNMQPAWLKSEDANKSIDRHDLEPVKRKRGRPRKSESGKENAAPASKKAKPAPKRKLKKISEVKESSSPSTQEDEATIDEAVPEPVEVDEPAVEMPKPKPKPKKVASSSRAPPSKNTEAPPPMREQNPN